MTSTLGSMSGVVLGGRPLLTCLQLQSHWLFSSFSSGLTSANVFFRVATKASLINLIGSSGRRAKPLPALPSPAHSPFSTSQSRTAGTSTIGFIRKMKVLPFPEGVCAIVICRLLKCSHRMSVVILVGSKGLQLMRQKRS